MKMTREALIWKLGFLGAVCGYLAAHTALVPPAWVESVKDISGLLGFICGLLGASPLPYGGGPKPFTFTFNGKDQR